jgi:predicted MFS family arabinose efflux permease
MNWTRWLILLCSRVLVSWNYRLVYPFLPAIARGLGISFQQAGYFLTARSAVGLLGLAAGYVGERIGYYRWMAGALCIFCVGAALIGTSWGFWPALAGFGLAGLAQTAYVPAVQAFIGTRVPYRARARVMGLMECSWAASWFLGVPLSGFLIARYGWRSPFLLIAALSVFALLLVRQFRQVERERGEAEVSAEELAEAAQVPETPAGERLPVAEAEPLEDAAAARFRKKMWIYGVTFFMVFANDSILIVYGAWLETAFGLEVETLGYFSAVVGVAELAGELVVAAIVDRLGKRRSMLGGLFLIAFNYLALSWCGHSLVLALGVLMGAFFLFEVVVVSSFAYISELEPSERGKLLAGNYTFAVGARMLSSITGPRLWAFGGGIVWNARVACVVTLLAFGLLLRGPGGKRAPGGGDGE